MDVDDYRPIGVIGRKAMVQPASSVAAARLPVLAPQPLQANVADRQEFPSLVAGQTPKVAATLEWPSTQNRHRLNVSEDQASSERSKQSESKADCAICLETLSLGQTQELPCGHTLHMDCAHKMRMFGVPGRCPLCRQTVEELTPVDELLHRAMIHIAQDAYSEAISLVLGILDLDPKHMIASKILKSWPYQHGNLLEILEVAHASGKSHATHKLACMYIRGEGVPQDLARAAQLLEAGAAVGNSDCTYLLALMSENGQGAEKDYVKAASLLEQAHTAGNDAATFELALLLNRGEPGVPQDQPRAAQLFEEAHSAGHIQATCELALVYQFGEGVPEDLTRAVELYEAAAIQGCTKAMKSLVEIGAMYLTGDGVEHDMSEAVRLFEFAHRLGYPQATFVLRELLQELGASAEEQAALLG